jgi:hypothetical protein
VVGVGLSSPDSHKLKQGTVFKNHPTHDYEIDPTVDGVQGRGTGHPWGALEFSAGIVEGESYESIVSIDKSFAEA